VITLSQHARGEILKAYPVDAARVHVVPPGIGADFHPSNNPAALAALRVKYGLGENYLLYGGGPEPRKNVAAVIGAFALVRHEHSNLELALFGPGIDTSTDIKQALRHSGVSNATHLLGFVPQADLSLLYAGARAFVYASRLEGFGIPPVEAMACGTPVIAAPNPPMPEVLGDAAWLTGDDTPEALARGVLRVLADPALEETLRGRGREHARQYTWHASARKTISIYTTVLAERSARDGRL
jgi:glycosyltransferase involved in cell wall biosynthesis